jgi:hypothetical protein
MIEESAWLCYEYGSADQAEFCDWVAAEVYDVRRMFTGCVDLQDGDGVQAIGTDLQQQLQQGKMVFSWLRLDPKPWRPWNALDVSNTRADQEAP